VPTLSLTPVLPLLFLRLEILSSPDHPGPDLLITGFSLILLPPMQVTAINMAACVLGQRTFLSIPLPHQFSTATATLRKMTRVVPIFQSRRIRRL
jgi:hypothetical protein